MIGRLQVISPDAGVVGPVLLLNILVVVLGLCIGANRSSHAAQCAIAENRYQARYSRIGRRDPARCLTRQGPSSPTTHKDMSVKRRSQQPLAFTPASPDRLCRTARCHNT